MARPGNWKDLIREYGWGSVERRLYAKTERGENGCVLWTGTAPRRSPPQIRMSAGPAGQKAYWVESVQRVAWMLRTGRFVPDGMTIQRSCCNQLCVEHLMLRSHRAGLTVCQYRKLRDAAGRGTDNPAAVLTRRQVNTIRRWAAANKSLAELADRYGVSTGCVYNVANGFTYRDDVEGDAPQRGERGRYRRSDRLTVAQRRGRKLRRFNAAQVRAMRKYVADGMTVADVARRWGMPYGTARKIVLRETYKDVA